MMRFEFRSSRMFLVQYTADGDITQGQESGRVEHIQSGASQRFTSRKEFEEFVSRILREESNETEAGCHTPE
jgi:hypothetical protein